jgi:GH24 family phage-related lysozyme (muramidase)
VAFAHNDSKCFSPIIYIYPAGYPTIGYGHLITEANKEQFLDGVDEDEALDLLRQDVVWAGGRKLKGLAKRRAAEAAIFQS